MVHSLCPGVHRFSSVTQDGWKEVSVSLASGATASNFLDVKGDVILVRFHLSYLTFKCLGMSVYVCVWFGVIYDGDLVAVADGLLAESLYNGSASDVAKVY